MSPCSHGPCKGSSTYVAVGRNLGKEDTELLISLTDDAMKNENN